jgi:hypothetical protein
MSFKGVSNHVHRHLKGLQIPTTRASDPGESCKRLMHNHTEMDKQLNCVLSEFSLKENQSDN